MANVLGDLETQRQQLALAKQYLLANDKTNAKSVVDAVVTALQTDSTAINAESNCDLLVS